MANIELHGFLGLAGNERNTTWTDDLIAAGKRIEEVSVAIEKALEGAVYDKETVLTTQLSTCGRSNDDPSLPFLRIWATSKEERDDIVRRLEPLDIDMELPPLLNDFVPRRSNRKVSEPQGWLDGLTKPGHAALSETKESPRQERQFTDWDSMQK